MEHVDELMGAILPRVHAAVRTGLEPDVVATLLDVETIADPLPYRATGVTWRDDPGTGLHRASVTLDEAWRVLGDQELCLDDFDAAAAERLRAVTSFATRAREAERRGVLAHSHAMALSGLASFPCSSEGIRGAATRLGGRASTLRLIAAKGDATEGAVRSGVVDERIDPPDELPPGCVGLLLLRGGGPHLLRIRDDLTLTWRRERREDRAARHHGCDRVFLTLSGAFFLDLQGRVAVLTTA